ncbi:5-formyltetrahydrofolate cyclo-ligase [Ascidiimonas sp. W6]|uniref:5-formyltetrahydrofolate cyclo-ligase n=1 Tax=Ascidiimonas meishanensis TaxID=3128903 RepID=UPI0030EBE59B
MVKSHFRNKYKKLRASLNPDVIASLSIQIANTSLQLPIWKFTYYHIFLPIAQQKEVDTSYLLSILQGKDKEVIVPKSDFNHHSLQHILLTDNTKLKLSEFGIPEPEKGILIPESDIEVVFIPLLAYDNRGNRIGYGKGFYDKFLSRCSTNTLKIGLSFFEPEEEFTEVSEYDIKLNYCITPKKIYSF